MKIGNYLNTSADGFKVERQNTHPVQLPPGFHDDPVQRIESANMAVTIGDKIKRAEHSTGFINLQHDKSEATPHQVAQAIRAYKQW